MTKEKWQDILGRVQDNFNVIDKGEEKLEEEGGVHIEFIEFDGPIGKMRLELLDKPVVLDRKTNYSRRVGSEVQVNYTYSADERTRKMIAYKWDEADEEWVEADAGMFK